MPGVTAVAAAWRARRARSPCLAARSRARPPRPGSCFATHDPLQTDVRAALLPPSAEHWFGTDQSGRDVYSRVVYGAGRSVGIGLLATALALVVGLVVGALSGVAPRVVDAAAMRGVDVLLAFPEFLVALLVVAVLGPGAGRTSPSRSRIAAVPVYIRLARAQTRTLASPSTSRPRASSGCPARLAFTCATSLPGVLGALSVLATIGIGSSILAAAGSASSASVRPSPRRSGGSCSRAAGTCSAGLVDRGVPGRRDHR